MLRWLKLPEALFRFEFCEEAHYFKTDQFDLIECFIQRLTSRHFEILYAKPPLEDFLCLVPAFLNKQDCSNLY